MKKRAGYLLTFMVLAALAASCAKNDGNLDSTSLKLAIDKSIMNLNSTVDKISSSQAFGLFTSLDGGLKSGEADPIYKTYITLDKINGVYEYKPVSTRDRWGFSLIRYFRRTADNSNMIVKMPLKKVKSPMSLRHWFPADSLLTNNFTIDVSDYHNNYNSYSDYDYLLDSKITIDNADAGSLYMKSLVSPTLGRNYFSQYTFAEGYTASYNYKTGDTIRSSFAISKGSNVVYKEERIYVKNDTARFGFEHTYILTIGEVSIIRNQAQRTVKIAVNGVVQPNAEVTVVDRESDQEPSVCRKREIQIKFEDGTTTTISELISESVENIGLIFRSLHQVYFAAYVVDWIAYDIYYQRN